MSEQRPNVPHPIRESMGTACIRGIAGLMGLSLALNAAGGVLWPRFDATVWMLDLRMLPASMAPAVGLVGGALLIAWAVRPASGFWMRCTVTLACAAMLGIAIANGFEYYRLLLGRSLHSGPWLAWSVVVAAALLLIISSLAISGHQRSRPRHGIACIAGGVAAGAFLLAQMTLFGTTDYRRPADAILVFGARVYADGTPSLAAADRVRTGVELFHAGLAKSLILSGGPGDGDVHEAEGMAAYAETLGVPRDAMVLDYNGLNTEASLRNARQSVGNRERVLVVSHFYHMARIKLCAERTGLHAYTVPARQQRTLARTPYYMAREAAALVVYYFRRPLWIRGVETGR